MSYTTYTNAYQARHLLIHTSASHTVLLNKGPCDHQSTRGTQFRSPPFAPHCPFSWVKSLNKLITINPLHVSWQTEICPEWRHNMYVLHLHIDQVNEAQLCRDDLNETSKSSAILPICSTIHPYNRKKSIKTIQNQIWSATQNVCILNPIKRHCLFL